MAESIKCKHCGQKRPGLGFAPFPNELGQRIATEICQPCWSAWLQKQTQIINHYGLDLTSPDAQNFLFDNIKGFLFSEVSQSAEIDTSKVETARKTVPSLQHGRRFGIADPKAGPEHLHLVRGSA